LIEANKGREKDPIYLLKICKEG